jgi:hypothetical protein
MKHSTGTKAHCDKLSEIADGIFGYPSRGIRFGGGKHHELGDTPGPGWTTKHANVRKHPTKDEHAYPIDDKLQDAPTDGLGLADQQTLEDAKAVAAELPEDWDDQGENED